ncbi:putative bifunctional diguanylate cyclase/phosphodiesterase [Thermodesulfobacteriota bacterium]
MMADAKVLVVDDIASNRFILVTHLKKHGISSIFLAENGREALETLRENRIDLVLLDVMMPEIDGYEVLRIMKADQVLRNIPVIMITALDEFESTVKCIELGAEDYLPKPFNAVLLRARISASLEKKHLRDVEREYLRMYDFTTGLPNQDLFTRRLGDDLRRLKRQESLFSVMLIRLKNYKKILDSLGQAAGREFIIAQGTRLEGLQPSGALLARLRHDEFALIVHDLNHAADGNLLAQELHEKLEEPLKIEGHDLSGNVGIGLAFSSTGYNNPEDMLRDAGLAANMAPQGGGYQIFDDDMHAEALERLELETDINLALSKNQFSLNYQPIIALDTRKIAGFEALIRWKHPDKGMVPPDRFIGLAEETKLIVPIGIWVLEEASRQAAVWASRLDGNRKITISVNVSSHQLKEENFLDILKNTLEKAQIKGSLLKLELTETALIDDPDRVDEVLKAVRKMDIQTALDDFGTGYCSLSYLHRFPINTLKIDQAFIRDIETKHRNRKIVQSTIDLAHKLGMDVTAEGVETDKEAEAVGSMNCEYAQGYLFQGPVPAEDATRLLFGE